MALLGAFIPGGGVHNYQSLIVRKLGVSDRMQAAIRAFEAGLLDPEASSR